MNRIDVVIVLYEPDIDRLNKSVSSLEEQVRKIYLVDNTESLIYVNKDILALEDKYGDKIEYIALNKNMGIGYAQNIGIKKSISCKSDFVIISDQDSVYPDFYVERMLEKEILEIRELAAISPLFNDENSRNQNNGFMVGNLTGVKTIYPDKGFFEIYQAIASGLIIKTKVINWVGFFNEDLFIDLVDYEWCWRVVANNYKIIGNANVIINHCLGVNTKNFFNKEIKTRNNLRYYYITRNSFYLSLNCKSLKTIKKIFLFLRSFKYIIGYTILSETHFETFKYTLIGFFHGINKKIGKYDVIL